MPQDLSAMTRDPLNIVMGYLPTHSLFWLGATSKHFHQLTRASLKSSILREFGIVIHDENNIDAVCVALKKFQEYSELQMNQSTTIAQQLDIERNLLKLRKILQELIEKGEGWAGIYLNELPLTKLPIEAIQKNLFTALDYYNKNEQKDSEDLCFTKKLVAALSNAEKEAIIYATRLLNDQTIGKCKALFDAQGIEQKSINFLKMYIMCLSANVEYTAKNILNEKIWRETIGDLLKTIIKNVIDIYKKLQKLYQEIDLARMVYETKLTVHKIDKQDHKYKKYLECMERLVKVTGTYFNSLKEFSNFIFPESNDKNVIAFEAIANHHNSFGRQNENIFNMFDVLADLNTTYMEILDDDVRDYLRKCENEISTSQNDIEFCFSTAKKLHFVGNVLINRDKLLDANVSIPKEANLTEAETSGLSSTNKLRP